MEQIILWESDAEIIRACTMSIYKTLKKLGIKVAVVVNSEPLLIGRKQLWGRLPVIEIRGLNWSLRPGCAFTVEELTPLFSTIFADEIKES